MSVVKNRSIIPRCIRRRSSWIKQAIILLCIIVLMAIIMVQQQLINEKENSLIQQKQNYEAELQVISQKKAKLEKEYEIIQRMNQELNHNNNVLDHTVKKLNSTLNVEIKERDHYKRRLEQYLAGVLNDSPCGITDIPKIVGKSIESLYHKVAKGFSRSSQIKIKNYIGYIQGVLRGKRCAIYGK